MRVRTWPLVGLVGVLAVAGPATAQPVRVALTGTTAPNGGTYTAFPRMPVLNASGQVAFTASLSGTSTSGIFAGSPGSLQTIAVQGGTAPSGGTYSSFLGGGIGIATRPVLNDSGKVGFYADLSGGSPTLGVYAGAAGSVQYVARDVDTAPGGGTYVNVLSPPAFNNAGQVAFSATTTTTQGLFRGAAGSVQAVARAGDAAPGGGNFAAGSSGYVFYGPSLNDNGQVAFTGNLTGTTASYGLYVGSPGAVQAVARIGDSAPGGGTYTNITGGARVQINSSGQVAFLANQDRVLVGTAGLVQVVVKTGDTLAGGETVSSLNLIGSVGTVSVAINHSGKVAFGALLDNSTTGIADGAIVIGSAGTARVVARDGTAAPGGGTYTKLSSQANQPALNGAGQIAFLSDLAGIGVTSANNKGLYAWANGTVQNIVRKGDVVDVDPGVGVDLRIVSDIAFNLNGVDVSGAGGLGLAFNDTGLLTYKLSFTDGSSGLFTSQLTPVPEPLTVGLLAAAGLALVRLRRR